MNSESGYFKLGLFVIAGVALMVGGVVFFGAGALFKEYIKVETATTRSVEGLSVGAAVKFNGVTIGKVSDIEMASSKHDTSDPVKFEEIRRYVVVELEINRNVTDAKTSAT